MGFFSKLKKVFNPGGAILSSYVGDGHDYRDPFEYAMKGGKNAKANQQAQLDAQAAQRQGMTKAPYTPAPGGVNSYPATRLGSSSGGYTYANNPFGGGGGSAPPPTPMSFGGGGAGITASGPQQMQMPQQPQMPQQFNNNPFMANTAVGRGIGRAISQLQPIQQAGNIQPAGAPTSGQPTMQNQMALVSALRGRKIGW
jgi:hypothetical protein